MQVLGPIFAGLIAALVVYLLSTFVKDQPKKIGDRQYVTYSPALKILCAAFFPISAFVTYAALQASPDQAIIAGIMALLFWLGTLYVAYDFFFVRLSYDDSFLYHWSPLKRGRKVPWSAVKDVQYASGKQVFYLKTEGYGTISVAPFANGSRALVEYAANKLGIPVPFTDREIDYDSDTDPDSDA